MSLTTNDFEEIRNIIESALSKQSAEAIKPIQDELEAFGNDIKEIYDMISDLQKSNNSDRPFKKLSIEKKLLNIHSDLVEAARQAGVTLPTHH